MFFLKQISHDHFIKMHPPTPLYSRSEIRKIENLATTLTHINGSGLMQKAGLAVAEIARDEIFKNGGQRVLILAGSGNNGGDALVAARYLAAWWFTVTVVFAGEANKLSGDAKAAFDAWLNAGGRVMDDIPAHEKYDAIIDGLFGIGLTCELAGNYLRLVHTVNTLSAQHHVPVLAIDIPSGLNSDTGEMQGAAIRANMTVTFIAIKPGLLLRHGKECCGEIILRTLDLDAPTLLQPRAWMLDQSYAMTLKLAPRIADSHKGDYGSVGILGGAMGMVGAALLAGRAALKLGAGRVYVSLLAQETSPNTLAVDMQQLELMLRPAHELLQLELSVIVAGSGMGDSAEAYTCLSKVLACAQPIVLDADALNLIAAHRTLAEILLQRAAQKIDTLLTPHPGEASRLLGISTAAVQRDRVAAAILLAQQYKSYVVLKGAGSICALPTGEYFINSSGNPALASAGTGDVLTGIIGAFIAQKLTAQNALLLAVYLHGQAADVLVKNGIGPLGLTASELIDAARNLINAK